MRGRDTIETASANSENARVEAHACPPMKSAGASARERAGARPREQPVRRAAPAKDSTVGSVSSWRMIRARVAPSARRSARSRRRAAPRPSSRPATFAQAIARTSATRPRERTAAARPGRRTDRGLAMTVPLRRRRPGARARADRRSPPSRRAPAPPSRRASVARPCAGSRRCGCRSCRVLVDGRRAACRPAPPGTHSSGPGPRLGAW